MIMTLRGENSTQVHIMGCYTRDVALGLSLNNTNEEKKLPTGQ